MDDEVLSDDPGQPPSRRARSAASQILMAAMLGLVDALGWERPPTETVQLAPDLTTEDLPLTFRHLPPLS